MNIRGHLSGRSGGVTVQDEIDLLRSALARAYDKRPPLLLRLVQAVRDRIGLGRPVIESLNIVENKQRHSVAVFQHGDF